MAVGWHFRPDNSGAFNYKDPVQYTVSGRASLTHTEILVREVLQNSLDNPSGSAGQGCPVRVVFRPVVLKGPAKAQFLEALHWSELRNHLASAREEQRRHHPQGHLASLEDIEGDDPLALLYIEDYSTRGLIGAELNSEVHTAADQFPPPNCFLGLCRNLGDNQKASGFPSGGTYGFGKSVLWKNSGCATVLFHSRLASPYLADDSRQVATRLFGQARLPSHWIGTQSFLQADFGVERQGQSVQPVYSSWNEEAEQVAGALGFAARAEGESGTSACVVMPVNLDNEEGEPDLRRNPTAFAQALIQASVRYFWPAIAEGRLTVEAKVHGEAPLKADIDAEPALADFVAAYRAATGATDEGAAHVSSFVVSVPKGPGAERATQGDMRVAVLLAQHSNDSGTDLKNRVALIRGSGMVVGYESCRRGGMNARDYHGVVVGGVALKNEGANAQGQARLERLLALAEPVTHDRWNHQSEQLAGWRGARAAIRHLVTRFNELISRATTDEVPPEGSAAPELARLFPLCEGSKGGAVRDMKVYITESGQRTLVPQTGESFYRFKFVTRVPSRQDFRGATKPTRWSVAAEMQIVGEGGGEQCVGRVHVKLNGYRTPDGASAVLQKDFEETSREELEVADSGGDYRFEGQTRRIPLDQDLRHRYRLRVTSHKLYGEE